MSYHHSNWVRQHSKVKDTFPMFILTVLAELADKDTGYVSADDETLAKMTRLSSRSVRRWMPLIPRDELRIVEKGGSPKGQRRTKTVYQVVNKEANDHGQTVHGTGSNSTKLSEDHGQSVPGTTPPTMDRLSPLKRRKRRVLRVIIKRRRVNVPRFTDPTRSARMMMMMIWILKKRSHRVPRSIRDSIRKSFR